MRKMLLALSPCMIAVVLAGCSSKDLTSLANTGEKKAVNTPVPPTATVAAPSILSTGYDSFAGNCPDADNEDVALLTYAHSQNYNVDMQLRITPTQGCDADPKSKAYDTFRRQVAQATLLLNAIDYSWNNSYTATRDTFLISVFQRLQAHYPSLSNVTITVVYGSNKQAILTYTGHGQPVVADPAS